MTPPPQIVYLLGAGASALRMPVVKGMEKLFLSVPTALNQYLYKENFSRSSQPFYGKALVNDISSYAENLADKIENHFSIDTYARKLYLSGKTADLRKLKTFMSMLFTIQQLTRGNDPRYDAFFSSIIELEESVPIFPSNISIVSWNYDLQVYNSVVSTAGLITPNSVAKFIGDIIPRDDYPNYYTKLNGIAGVSYQDRSKVDFREHYSHFDFEKIKENGDSKAALMKNLGQFWIDQVYENHIMEPLIEFSWENSAFKKKQLEIATEQFKNASALVIIGYSFPTFNKRTDQILLKSLPNKVKIYIQCHNETDKVVERVQMMIPDFVTKDHFQEVIPVYDSDEFYIPHEFFT